jgi:hypothetical protein
LRRHRTAFVATASSLLLSLATLSGCGPIEYINQVGNRAASAVSAAKLAQADRYAPYEMTGAEEYLHKAREEAGYAQYQDAIDYGRRAEELAIRARAIAVEKLAQQPSKSTKKGPKTETEEPRPAREGEAPGEGDKAPEPPR